MDDVYDLYQRGMALLEDGHFHQAIIPLSKARDQDPEKTSIREALGRAAEARKPLTLAANMNPKRRDYRIYRDRARKAA